MYRVLGYGWLGIYVSCVEIAVMCIYVSCVGKMVVGVYVSCVGIRMVGCNMDGRDLYIVLIYRLFAFMYRVLG